MATSPSSTEEVETVKQPRDYKPAKGKKLLPSQHRHKRDGATVRYTADYLKTFFDVQV